MLVLPLLSFVVSEPCRSAFAYYQTVQTKVWWKFHVYLFIITTACKPVGGMSTRYSDKIVVNLI